jgi:hypothetical protein
MAIFGSARQGWDWLGEVRIGEAWRSLEGCGMAISGKAWLGKAWRGWARHVCIGLGWVGTGEVW